MSLTEDLASASRMHQPSQVETAIDTRVRRDRVLNAIVSGEAMMQARIAALQSHMTFKAYLDHLLRRARPIEADSGDTAQTEGVVDSI